jgi:coatomer subunit beta
MVVLDRLINIKLHHPKVLHDLIMDILGALSSPNMDIRRKTLDIVLDLVSPKNVEDVVMLLKKEIQKTQSKEVENASEYRQLLIQSIHSCAVKVNIVYLQNSNTLLVP